MQKKKALEEAYELDPGFPLIHLALASVEADPERAAFLRDFDLKRLPDSCNYTTDLDPAEITLEAAEMCAEQKDWSRVLVALNKYAKVGKPNSCTRRTSRPSGEEPISLSKLTRASILAGCFESRACRATGAVYQNVPVCVESGPVALPRELIARLGRDLVALDPIESVHQACL